MIILLKTLTDGLEWCGLLWCFYQQFGLSFWRHPFTAEESLLNKWCYISPNLFRWRNKLIFYGLRVRKLSVNCHFWVNYSFKELKHFKWQTTKLQRMLVIINRLSSVGLEANIDIFTVIILGVNKPLHNPQTKYKIHSSYLNINVKKCTGKMGCFIGVADKNHNFKIWGVSLNWHQFESYAQLDRVLSLLLYGWWRAQKPSVIGCVLCWETHIHHCRQDSLVQTCMWSVSHWNLYITAAQAQLTRKTAVGFSSATRVLYSDRLLRTHIVS